MQQRRELHGLRARVGDRHRHGQGARAERDGEVEAEGVRPLLRLRAVPDEGDHGRHAAVGGGGQAGEGPLEAVAHEAMLAACGYVEQTLLNS